MGDPHFALSEFHERGRGLGIIAGDPYPDRDRHAVRTEPRRHPRNATRVVAVVVRDIFLACPYKLDRAPAQRLRDRDGLFQFAFQSAAAKTAALEAVVNVDL